MANLKEPKPSTSLARKAAEALVDWMTKQFLDRWGLPILLGLLPTIWLWLSGQLTATYTVPHWGMALAGATGMALIGIVLVLAKKRGALKKEALRLLTEKQEQDAKIVKLEKQVEQLKSPVPPIRFEARGLLWRVTVNFWSVFRSFNADEGVSLKTLLGPYCPNCEAEVSDDLLAGRLRCHDCQSVLKPTVPIQAENKPNLYSLMNSDPLRPIRKAAYNDAQRKANKGELRRELSAN